MRGLLISVLMTLAACGGGGEPTGASRTAAFDRYFSDIDAMDVTPASQLPTTGDATYGGDIQLQLPIGADAAVVPYVGVLEMRVHFDPAVQEITGHADGFVSGGDILAGHLLLSDGRIDRDADPVTDYQFAAKLSGPLSRAGHSYDIVADIAGDFRGRRADAVSGVVFGTVSDTAGLDIFDGTFAATAP